MVAKHATEKVYDIAHRLGVSQETGMKLVEEFNHCLQQGMEDKFENAVLGEKLGLASILIKHPHKSYQDSNIPCVDCWQGVYNNCEKELGSETFEKSVKHRIMTLKLNKGQLMDL